MASKTGKRLLAIFLATLLCAFALPVGAGAFAGGSGTASDPFIITTPAQLDAVRNNLSAHYRLANNIDMSGFGPFDPIGSGKQQNSTDTSNYFKGVFNGNNFTIMGLEVVPATTDQRYAGLFGYAYSAEITDLHLTNLQIDLYNYSYVGGIAGFASGIMRNCSVRGSIRVEDDRFGIASVYVGGVMGYCSVGTAENLAFDGSIYANGRSTTRVGGICGDAGTKLFKNCESAGTLEVVGGSSVSAGGISGEVTGTSINPNANVVDCISSMNITCPASTTGYVGGVVGYFTYGIMARCKNMGLVTSTSYAGGIVGYGRNASITSCSNVGAVSAPYRMGGIAGNLYSSVVRDCFNSGPVGFTGGITTIHAGGIVGSFQIGSQMLYCGNTGNVSLTATNTDAELHCGGVVGLVGGTNSGQLYGCYSLADVTATGGSIRAGGVAGSLSSAATALNCYSHGNVEANSTLVPGVISPLNVAYAGGVVGSAQSSSSAANGTYVGNSYHYGTVKANGQGPIGSGGVAGAASGTLVNNCYSWDGAGAGSIGLNYSNFAIFGGGILSIGQMRQESAYDGFNFINDWEIVPGQNNGMPRLRSMQLPDSARPGMPANFGRPVCYTVTFNCNDQIFSPTILSATVLKDGTYGSLPTPTRQNFVFDGWYTAANGGTKINPSDSVTGNITLYAHWIFAGALIYTIFVTNGTADKATATTGETVTITAGTAPSGQRFKSWTVSPAVTFTGGTGAASATAKFTMPAGNVTATAVYENIPDQPPKPPKKIFRTRYDSNFLNWILFILLFGWIWMWF